MLCSGLRSSTLTAPPPPNTAAIRKPAVKGVIIYNKEEPYLGLENGWRYLGGREAVNEGVGFGGRLYFTSTPLPLRYRKFRWAWEVPLQVYRLVYCPR